LGSDFDRVAYTHPVVDGLKRHRVAVVAIAGFGTSRPRARVASQRASSESPAPGRPVPASVGVDTRPCQCGRLVSSPDLVARLILWCGDRRESLEQFFSLTLPLLDERHGRLLVAAAVEMLGRAGQAR
jgi:hypothetical protein